MKFSAVAFDLDGTLYPNFSFYLRLFPFILKEQRLIRAFGKARIILRNSSQKQENADEDFYKLQAKLMGKILGENAEKLMERVEKLIYRGWEPIFERISLFPHVRETLDAFRGAGVKMGLLSDFPPETKLKNMNISGYWDAVLCSEQTGRLKPDKKPFLNLAALMGKAPEEILYVGNSFSYDVEGARKTGMKAAHIRSRWKKFAPPGKADFVFYDYRQLRDYVLG